MYRLQASRRAMRVCCKSGTSVCRWAPELVSVARNEHVLLIDVRHLRPRRPPLLHPSTSCMLHVVCCMLHDARSVKPAWFILLWHAVEWLNHASLHERIDAFVIIMHLSATHHISVTNDYCATALPMNEVTITFLERLKRS